MSDGQVCGMQREGLGRTCGEQLEEGSLFGVGDGGAAMAGFYR